jgi:hypothetical protein
MVVGLKARLRIAAERARPFAAAISFLSAAISTILALTLSKLPTLGSLSVSNCPECIIFQCVV